jgi:hypothetical protein
MAKKAFIIAIKNYKQLHPLPGTHEHALAFRKFLIESQWLKPENIYFCTEDPTIEGRTADATRPAIKMEMERLRASGDQEASEELFFYFSGHGFCYTDIDDKPTADVLAAADYVGLNDPNASDKCLKLDEIQSWLKMCLGVVSRGENEPAPGHYYFIDACRNLVSERDLKVSPLGLRYQVSRKKKPSVFTLYSAGTGALAPADDEFPTVLLDGLNGHGRAKRPYQDTFAVVFDSLSEYVAQRLKIDLNPRSDGSGGVIKVMPKQLNYTCTITVYNADGADTFKVEVRNRLQQVIQNLQFTFVGKGRSFNAAPDDYFVRVELVSPPGEVVTPTAPQRADLYDDCALTYAKQPPPSPIVLRDIEVTPEPATGMLNVIAPYAAEVVVREGEKDIARSPVAAQAELAPGHYVIETRDARGITVDRRPVTVAPGQDETLDLREFRTSPLRDALRSEIQGQHLYGSVDFSESLGWTPDQGLDLWLALIGAARITGGADDYSKLSPLPLATFDHAQPGDAPFYVLAGFEQPNVQFRAHLSTSWREPPVPVAPHPTFPGLFELVERASQASHRYLTLQVDGTVPITVGVHSLPNRGTLVTVSREPSGALRIQQFMFALKGLEWSLPQGSGVWPDQTQKALQEVSAPLRLARRCVEVQRAFSRSQELDHVLSSQELDFLLYFKWYEPVVALLAAYELIRRGETEALPEVVRNLRRHFADLPDTDALARLAELDWKMPTKPPLVLEGFQALDLMTTMPFDIPPGDAQLFRGPWTMWRGLV